MFLSQEVVGFTPGKSAFQSQGSCPWQRCDQRCRTLVNGGRKREDQSRARRAPGPTPSPTWATPREQVHPGLPPVFSFKHERVPRYHPIWPLY